MLSCHRPFTSIARLTREAMEVLCGRRCRICSKRLVSGSAAGLCDNPDCLKEAESLQIFSGI